jgi:hypothetical protein
MPQHKGQNRQRIYRLCWGDILSSESSRHCRGRSGWSKSTSQRHDRSWQLDLRSRRADAPAPQLALKVKCRTKMNIQHCCWQMFDAWSFPDSTCINWTYLYCTHTVDSHNNHPDKCILLCGSDTDIWCWVRRSQDMGQRIWAGHKPDSKDSQSPAYTRVCILLMDRG